MGAETVRPAQIRSWGYCRSSGVGEIEHVERFNAARPVHMIFRLDKRPVLPGKMILTGYVDNLLVFANFDVN
jgi:hypothetical protein